MNNPVLFEGQEFAIESARFSSTSVSYKFNGVRTVPKCAMQKYSLTDAVAANGWCCDEAMASGNLRHGRSYGHRSAERRVAIANVIDYDHHLLHHHGAVVASAI